ncbi:Cytochrome P450 [Corchorus olitorius]|uniref:Cytochrome P450 n=1 Tax=Corchorus olitorius TaxID=93759 RepID=A0A1R3HNZ2_9ROSI|nr:Cytochrome P450 [Corchorus olitorius]
MNSMAAILTVLLTGSLCLYLLISLISNFLQKYWFTPLRIQRAMNLQGIKGPSYKFIHGNNKETLKMMKEAESKPMATMSHDILPRVHPHIYSGLKSYGKCHLSWRGTIPELYITEPELVKELLKSNDGSGAFPKRTSRERKKIEEDFVFKLIGDGLVTAEGQKWARQRKLANYAFHGESLKNMTPAMIASVETMLERWKQFEGKEMEVFQEFRLLTSEVISRTAFGSSYLEGEKIFDMMRKLAVLANRSFFKTKLPPLISKFWKTADSIEADKLVKGIHNSVMKMVKKREEKVISGEANSFGTDFLGLLLKSFHDPDKNNRLSVQDLVDECKTFYLAGQETVNSALGWTVLLLAIHSEWQEKARKEVIEVFGNQNPHSEGIGKLKTKNEEDFVLRLLGDGLVTSEGEKWAKQRKLANYAFHGESLKKYWFTPLRIQRVMTLQGIKGPSYKFMHGNNKETLKMMKEAESKPMATLSHDILPRVHPHIYAGLKSYGKCHLSWRGTIPELYITEPELVKELLKSNDGSGAFPKRTSRERKKIKEDFVFKLVGDGLVTAEGQKWAKQRKLANYAFHGESLKNMTPAMIASVETMLQRWKQFEGKEIEVFQEFRLLTSEVISRTAFGSSYLEGEKIFDMLRKLAVLVRRSLFKTKLPPVISKFWKTADSIEADKLVKGIHNSVMKMVKKREEKVISGEADIFGTDFLGLLLKSFHDPDKNNRLSVQDLVDECKTFYLAGQETVNSALGWTVLLLAIHPEWQEKARKEVIEVFGNQNPHSEGIGKLKIHAMNLQGIKGPSYKFIHGNNKETLKMIMETQSKPMATFSHDIFPRVHPHIYSRINSYGKCYLSWRGSTPELYIIEPEIVKELLKSNDGSGVFPKRTSRERKNNEEDFVLKLLGDGLVTSQGEKWARQRKLANYAFHGESLKRMTPAVIASVETMLKRWKKFEGKEIEVFQEFRLLTSEVISRTAFGSSYLDGEKIFDMLKKLSALAGRNFFKTKLPPVISKFWKTTDSIESNKLVKGIHDSIMEMVKKREEKVFSGEANNFGTDFLGLLVSSFHDPDKKNRLSVQDLVDECKTFYLGGQETVNSTLAWTVLLLAIHTEWQEKARNEVFEVFGNQNPHSEGIGKLKIKYWFTPLRIQRVMNLQGIKGPSYKFFHGNNKETLKMIMEAQSKPMAALSHDILPRVHPHNYSWLNLYGKCYLSWRGSIPELYITEPELVKELLKSNDGSGAFPKMTSRQRKNKEEDFVLKLLGDGIILAEGQKWAKQRKLANYAFHGESLKNMTPAMIASVETMLEKWKQFEGKEIEVYQELRLLTSEVISRTAFGSSYLEGEKIFDMLGKLAVLANKNAFKTKLPPVISKLWKTADNIESDKLVKGIHDSVMKMVKKREEKVFSGEANNFGTDFLGLLVNSFHDPENNRLSIQDLVDECKTFYLAGQETVNSALAWTVLLLAIHMEWQEKARKEVIEVFGNQNPHSEGIGKLKIANWNLQIMNFMAANLTLPVDLLTASLYLYLAIALIKFLQKCWLTPIRMQLAMNLQGIKGPCYKFIHGNNKQILKMIMEAQSKPMATL